MEMTQPPREGFPTDTIETPQINTPAESIPSLSITDRIALDYPMLRMIHDGVPHLQSTLQTDGNPDRVVNEVKLILGAYADALETIAGLRSLLSRRTQEYTTLDGRLKASEREFGVALIDKATNEQEFQRTLAQKDAMIKDLALRSPRTHLERSAWTKEPPIFDGKTPKDLPEFIQKVNMKLHTNSDWWHTEQQRMGYVTGLIEGDAFDQIKYGIQDGTNILFANVKEILEVLKTAYGDLHAKTTAAKTIMTLKQGNNPMTTFLPKWHSTAKMTSWDDDALIDHLRAAVHVDILNRLSYVRDQDIPKDLATFVDLIRRLDYEVRTHKPGYFKPQKSSNTHDSHTYAPPATTTTQPPTGDDPMEITAYATSVAKPTWTKSDVDSGRRPTTDEEREARKAYNRAHDLCQWCSSGKHSSPKCPTAPWATTKNGSSPT
jgi:hypothetical protein